MSGCSVFKKYIPAKGHGVNNLKLEVYYHLGGMNYFNYKVEKRGYYLSVTPVDRSDHGGYVTESVTLGSGIKMLIKEVSRQSSKAAQEAVTLSKNHWHQLIDYVCQHSNVEVEELEDDGTI